MARFAIIDTAQRPYLHERLDKLEIGYHSLFDGQAEENLKEIAPLLVEEDGAAQLGIFSGELQRLGERKPAVSFVVSPDSAGELANHFRAFHLVKVPEKGGREMLLRWYDTRILPVWLQIMTAEQQAAFVGRIQQWQYFDRFGDLQELVLPPPLSDRFPALSPLTLDEAQYARFLDACEPDVAIAQLRRIIPDEIRRVPYRALYPFVSAHLEDSKAHGVTQIDDHVQYLLLALYTSGNFRQHPTVAERLERPCKQWPEPFADWAIALPEDVWETGRPMWEELASVEPPEGTAPCTA